MFRSSYYIFFCFLFLVFKILAISFTQHDLFGDEAQYWLWSKNLDFGYYSKPPLLSWFVFLFCFLFGDNFFVIKIIPIFFYILSSYLIYLIAYKLWKNKELAFLASVTFFLMPAVSFSSFILSTDVLLIFFWNMSLFQLLNLLNKARTVNFVLLGLFLGLAFLSKYAAVYFFLCLAFLFFEKRVRVVISSNIFAVFLFFVVFLLVVSPNIIWNINNGWLTFGHTADNAALDRISFNLFNVVIFILSQAVMLGPVIFIVFFFVIKKNLISEFNNRFLVYFSFPIFFIILIESYLVRANANWAAVSLISFLILFVRVVFKHNKAFLNINNVLNLLLGVVFFGLIATSSKLEPFKRISGISDFGNDLKLENLEDFENIVISDRMLFSNLSFIFQKDSFSLYVPYKKNSKIGHHFQKSNPLPENFNKDFVLIGHEDEIGYLINEYNANLIDKKNVGFSKDKLNIYEVSF